MTEGARVAGGVGEASATQLLPGLELASSGRDADGVWGATLDVWRTAANGWLVAMCAPLGPAAAATAAALRSSASSPAAPSVLLARAADELARDGRAAASCAVLASVELDACGAWLTVANAGPMRPVVVRRAGWIDVRGHPSAPLGHAGPAPADDRVGLGPGDAIVLGGVDPTAGAGDAVEGVATTATTADAGRGGRDRDPGDGDVGEVLHEALFASFDLDAHDVAERCAAALAVAAGGDRPSGAAVVAIRVPEELGDDPVGRVAAATGIPRDDLELPGYPLGDLQPDLWKQPPRPPREARFLLAHDAARLAEVRRLLRRLLASWRLDALLDEGDVELLATEITTNALRHAGTAATVVVRYLGDAVRVEVGDGSQARPELQQPGPDDVGGRGIELVRALSSSWGVLPTRGGKRVWFEVPAPGPPH